MMINSIIRIRRFLKNNPKSGGGLFLTLLFAVTLQFSLSAQALTCNEIFGDIPKVASSSLSSIIGQLRSEIIPFKSSIPVSSYIEVVAIRYFYTSSGVEVGKALVFQPIESNVKELAKGRSNLEPYRTEIDINNRNLFELLGFKEEMDPIYGKYMGQVPDAKLFEYLRAQYNARVPEHLRINMGIYQSNVVSAHQTEIVTNWVKNATVAIGDPAFGSVFGLKPHELAEKIEDGKERNSIYRHDLEHFASILLLSKKVVERNRLVGRFWEKVLQYMKNEVKEGRMDRNGKEWRSIMDTIYVYTRRFHSLTHVLGMLVRNQGAIDVNTQKLKDFGYVASVETPTVHWVGLGFRPNWVTEKDLPFASRLLEIGLEESNLVDKPVTIADAYGAVTNEALQQAKAFAENYPDPINRMVYKKMLEESGLISVSPLSKDELQELQKLTLERYHQMGH